MDLTPITNQRQSHSQSESQGFFLTRNMFLDVNHINETKNTFGFAVSVTDFDPEFSEVSRTKTSQEPESLGLMLLTVKLSMFISLKNNQTVKSQSFSHRNE